MDWQQKIILVSPFFYPELISTGKANQFLAEAFVADGHGVTVVCSHPLYPAWIPVASEAGLSGMNIQRGGAQVRYPKAMPLRRMVLEAWFAVYACWRVWHLRKQADIVISVLPPSLFALLLDCLLPRRTRRVAVVHDLQGVLAAQETSAPRRAIIRLIHAVESRAFRAQDLCIFFSGDMARIAQKAYGLEPRRVAVQYPFITFAATETHPVESDIAQDGNAGRRLTAILPPNDLHVVYSGALGYKQNSQQLVTLMHVAAKRFPEVGFHVFSGGPFFDELCMKYKREPGPRVQFHPLVAQQDLGELYARSAIQIIPQAEGTEAAALPSKLPNLLAAGVHLLAICTEDSEVGRLVQQAGTGSLVERWDEDLFMQRLQEALEIVKHETAFERRERVGPLLKQFSVSNLVQLVLDGQTTDLMRNRKSVDGQEESRAAVAQGGVRP